MTYQLRTLPINGFRVIDTSGKYPMEWFDSNGFERADNHITKLREDYPNETFELLAEVSV